MQERFDGLPSGGDLKHVLSCLSEEADLEAYPSWVDFHRGCCVLDEWKYDRSSSTGQTST